MDVVAGKFRGHHIGRHLDHHRAGPAVLGPRFVTRDPTLLRLPRTIMRDIVDVPDYGAELAKERESARG